MQHKLGLKLCAEYFLLQVKNVMHFLLANLHHFLNKIVSNEAKNSVKEQSFT